MLTTTFKLTEEEVYNSILAISRSRSLFKIYKILGVLYLTLAFGQLYLVFFYNYSIDIAYYFFFLIALMMINAPRLTAKYHARKSFKSNAPITESLCFKFTNTRYELQGESFRLECAYHRLIVVEEIKGLILFRRTEGHANVLPIRILSTDEHTELREILASIPDLTVRYSISVTS